MYKIGDKIKKVRNYSIETPTDIIDTGVVTKGPSKVDGIDHYCVKWNSLGDDIRNELPEALLNSRKYSYRLI